MTNSQMSRALPLSISSEQLPPQERLPYWREVFGRTVLNLNIDPLAEAPFHCDATLHALPGLSLAALTTSPTRVSRTRDLIADGKTDFCLTIPREGTAFASHLGRDVSLAEGAGVLCRSAEPGSLAFRSTARFVILGIPADVLLPMLRDVDAAVMRPIAPDTAALQLLIGYADLLLHRRAETPPDLQRRTATHMHDLVALAVGAVRDAEHVARGRGARAARFAAIRADILANLSQVRLSPKMIARRHNVTERYVHLLFEETGATFSAFVSQARLDRARDLLLDRAGAGLKISDIAHRVGYGEITTFNRAFRRRFGDTPSGLRRQ